LFLKLNKNVFKLVYKIGLILEEIIRNCVDAPHVALVDAAMQVYFELFLFSLFIAVVLKKMIFGKKIK
jgi:hypothetical protein